MNEKTEQQERTEFAAFVLKRWGHDEDTRSKLADFHSGIYGTGPLQFAWCAWKERAASPSSKSTKALIDAATSLETIAALAGRKTFGDPPIETYMDTFMDVRHYAASRARVARAALASSSIKEDGPPFARGSWQHAVDDFLVGYMRTSQDFATPHEAVGWLVKTTGDAALACHGIASIKEDGGGGEPDSADAIEAKARDFYEDWKTMPGWVPWSEGGNSHKQDEARRLARIALGVQPSPPSPLGDTPEQQEQKR